MRILTVNAGSSSVKIRLLGPSDELLAVRDVTADRGRPEPGALEAALSGLDAPDAVAHRVVHGGSHHPGPVRVDKAVLAELEGLVDMAPLHQAPALAALRATEPVCPDVPAVACFDTAFHATMPDGASTYAVPRRWRSELGVRRYGFHGLAHEWASSRVRELAGPVERIVVAHLGSGASVCAVHDGCSVDSSMGFTPTSGLVMGTRCGDLDPAVPAWLMHHGLGITEVQDALSEHSGLVALAGSADMREVLAREAGGDPDASLAIRVWLHRLRAEIASMAAALGGLDALVFSGGVGERAAVLRRRAADGLGFLGVELDQAANGLADGRANTPAEVDVSAPGSGVRTWVVHTREDLVMASQARALLAG
jgi:acetate kinase